ncbi:MAG: PAS domain S-box protein [Isosphaerales bacterium]
MPETIPRPVRVGRQRWSAAFLISVAWLLVVALAVWRLRQVDGVVVALAGLGAAAITFGVEARAEKARWRDPVKDVTRLVRGLRRDRKTRPSVPPTPELVELTQEIVALARSVRLRSKPPGPESPGPAKPSTEPGAVLSGSSLTRSGLFDAPPPDQGPHFDPLASGDYSTTDMVNRLEPAALHWIESSPAEQEFLGWTLTELRQKSFLDVLHPDDRDRARGTFGQALVRGEALGLVVRMRSAQGKTYMVEVNVGARYGTNQKVTHLRCHLTDVSQKVRAERELRLRTRELTRVNEQLRKINRELGELKDRYTDLYENAPAMYLSLDLEGKVIECNQTMLSTLGLARDQVVGYPYERFLHGPLSERFKTRFKEFLRAGSVEKETCWVKSNGEMIDVWIRGSLVAGLKGSITHARLVAQDVTANRRLEEELQEKNQRLAEANQALSLRNHELDEFVYVVSHDLQEPLRTLIAFSDFLLRDYGDRIAAEGQEYVHHLVDASRRMRSMIHGLLTLSRAGKVIGEFATVNLEELVAVVKTDLGELFRCKRAELRIKSALPNVWGDRDRIGQLLANLISNAIKYNQNPTPWVEVDAITQAGDDSPDIALDPYLGPDVIVAIKDNGIGIEPQFHGTIFQLFRRLHTQDEYEGTGAGLSICNKIVQAHGGRIWVESALGQGATFFIRLRGGPSQSSTSTSAPTVTPPASPSYETPVSQVPADERHTT